MKNEHDSFDKKFKKIIKNHYNQYGRHNLVWRHDTSPYSILISEIMLQQTQVSRVISYYEQWMREFPDLKTLTNASREKVLMLWKGLGYNNRALRLHRLAFIITNEYKGVFPNNFDAIKKLPGIGPYTAGAIMNFSYKIGMPLIETNIRRVYIHHYFKDSELVHDKELLPIIESTMDKKNPDIWFWALMDYGSFLPKIIKKNDNKKSRHYSKQSKFEGSDRQCRATILNIVVINHEISIENVFSICENDEERASKIVEGMIRDGLLTQGHGKLFLNKA